MIPYVAPDYRYVTLNFPVNIIVVAHLLPRPKDPGLFPIAATIIPQSKF